MKLLFENWRKYLNEKTYKSDVLVLVHPDAVWDHFKHGTEFIEEYYKKLQEEIGKFDKVFTLFLYPEKYYANDGEGFRQSEEQEQAYKLLVQIKNYLTQETEVLPGANSGREAFEGTIGDYLIEHDEVNIFISGGNQGLCLKNTYESFCSVLDWIVEEKGLDVKIYRPLVYRRGGKPDEETNRITLPSVGFDEKEWKEMYRNQPWFAEGPLE